jgi:hypothetical protein
MYKSIFVERCKEKGIDIISINNITIRGNRGKRILLIKNGKNMFKEFFHKTLREILIEI